jgi:hypothetical protein
MAGYAVECSLKALVLAQTPKKRRADVLASFRGNVGHDFDWLRRQYLAVGGQSLPTACLAAFTLVNFWGTNLRYEPGTIPVKDAEEFLHAVRVIREWADGRLS